MRHTPVERPRRLIKAWHVVRKGLPSAGRYRRYLLMAAPALVAVWAVTAAYLMFAPVRYASEMTLILPGSGVGGSMNVDSIGQASSVTASAFSSATLSPTENYKRLLMSDVTLRRAARVAGESEDSYPAPAIKLVDQTNLIEITIAGPSPRQAQANGAALRTAFLAGLDRLRDDESIKRESADRARIGQLQDKVRAAQRRLLAFQGETGLVSLEQFNSRVGALDTLHLREREARTALAQQAAQRSRLGVALRISTDGARRAMLLKADPLFQSQLARYATIATSDTEAAATLGANHGTRQQLDAERGALRDAMVARGAALTGLARATLLSFADLSVTEGRARMFETLVSSDSQAAGAAAAVAEIRRQIDNQTATSDALVKQASLLADLVRDQRVAEAVFSSALARLDTNKSDPFASYPLVQTLEEPSLPKTQASPSKKIAIAGALGASLLIVIGFGLAWLRQPILNRLLPNA
ncbi:hypothetical protein HMP09_2079 [Sphingomonas sp. HMP9]|uniref:GumC family protein n=1 Tax=Sphingomonas sp. HMP9 TaxID=1517554 RepID=UPI0015968C02|nr:hypothetical protein [Sphingomonas sp. HMP9]BCA62845.1 hypothetical protein HMP09_2079 [Sphingomonas sp. HMP9]